jgi:hypothetical protein
LNDTKRFDHGCSPNFDAWLKCASSLSSAT